MTSLYRRHRPTSFAEVIGQDYIVKILQNQIANKKIAHAYLFCGSRGTGKTTIAKIFAREINGNAKGGADLDIFEIDAASNNSVQDVRDLIDKVKYPPVASTYKIYIIDEVHMFSASAFNAFLKTLEEPPAHTIFILCTTEPTKIIPTVQSRCLRFDFRPATDADIKKLLSTVMKKEKLSADAPAIEMLATAGSGSFRDALSYAETVAGFTNGAPITEIHVAEVLGTVPPELLRTLFTHIKSNKISDIKSTCKKIFERGINTNLLVKNFLETVKTETPFEPHIFRTFAELEMSIKSSLDPRIHFENTCLLACGGK